MSGHWQSVGQVRNPNGILWGLVKVSVKQESQRDSQVILMVLVRLKSLRDCLGIGQRFRWSGQESQRDSVLQPRVGPRSGPTLGQTWFQASTPSGLCPRVGTRSPRKPLPVFGIADLESNRLGALGDLGENLPQGFEARYLGGEV